MRLFLKTICTTWYTFTTASNSHALYTIRKQQCSQADATKYLMAEIVILQLQVVSRLSLKDKAPGLELLIAQEGFCTLFVRHQIFTYARRFT